MVWTVGCAESGRTVGGHRWKTWWGMALSVAGLTAGCISNGIFGRLTAEFPHKAVGCKVGVSVACNPTT